MRVLLITTNPPMPSSGGSMLLYRHFCERNNFKIYVISNDPNLFNYHLPYKFSLVQHSKLWNRLIRTRFFKHLHSCEHLFFGKRIPKQLLNQVKEFNPDIVFSIAGSWSWTTRLAGEVANYLKVPLVGSFMDWWSYNLIYAPWAESLIESEFRRFYQKCDLALCISEGMQEALGKHPNSVVLYPIGSAISDFHQSHLNSYSSSFTIAFAGNLGDWYGKMLEDLVNVAQNHDISFKIFGHNPSWSSSFQKKVIEQDIYQGQIPLEKLRQEIKSVDVLLLLMGFNETCAQVEKTSFKSKLLDYLSFQKPILVWGPDYCSAVQITRKFNSAEICTSPSADDCLKMILKVKQDYNQQFNLLVNAQNMYHSEFHPDKIHELFVTKMSTLLLLKELS